MRIAPPTAPATLPLDHGILHARCGKDGGCDCDHCVGGKCRENHPFMTATDGMEAVKQLGKATMCVRIGGIRLWECANGTCKECKDAVFMKDCPLQHSGRH